MNRRQCFSSPLNVFLLIYQPLFSQFSYRLRLTLTRSVARTNIRASKVHQMFHARRNPWKTRLQQPRRAAPGV